MLFLIKRLMMKKLWIPMLFIAICLTGAMILLSCGDDDDDDSNDDDDDSNDDDDDLFDPLERIGEAWDLAEEEMGNGYDLLTLFQIEGTAVNSGDAWANKEFTWEYLFYAEWTAPLRYKMVKIVFLPSQTVEILCDEDESGSGCEVLGRVFLTEAEWGDAVIGYDQMILTAKTLLAPDQVDYISIFEDLNPSYQFIGYYLQNQVSVLLLINAENGEIVE